MGVIVGASTIVSMAKSTGKRRPKGSIERRGNSFRVKVYAGVDPLTGKRTYLSDSTTDERKAEKILTRLRAQVDKQRNARTQGTLRTAIEEWLPNHDVEESTRKSYELYFDRFVYPALGDEPIVKITPKVLEDFYAELRRCRARCNGKPFVEHREEGEHECRVVKHKRPPGRRPAAGYPKHDCDKVGCKVIECQTHTCNPLAPSTISKIHFVLSAVFAACVRWEWIDSNPADVARKPRQPSPEPEPPSAEQASRIVEAAWSENEDWGTLVWLVMVTGLRRAELLALRWRHVDLGAGYLTVRQNYLRMDGKTIEKDTKAHRMRRIALDSATVEVLREHRIRYDEAMTALGVEPTDEAYLFSYQADYARPYDPDGVTHKYARMCQKIGIDSHLHALRHYSATELLAAGVDLRAVAGRLGHGGGGATTLRVYAAWVNESDRRAADILGSRMQRPRQS